MQSLQLSLMKALLRKSFPYSIKVSACVRGRCISVGFSVNSGPVRFFFIEVYKIYLIYDALKVRVGIKHFHFKDVEMFHKKDVWRLYR